MIFYSRFVGMTE
ncbi:hypothetical protein CAEBREN_17800 [Caenorhabditis brenneri]|uniref:Uncharacterized protein n=1 Tax=Caenorhabditis brenneri TaxID=135651 RepID=G0PJJ7_CAEBE|nr:hypothetical protein CAEBREN_17800 [Caenorhabditis brenneri]